MKQTPESDGKEHPYHSRVRQRQAEETRRRILTAARSLFESQGYAATMLEAITKVALVSPKTIAAAFGSKRALLVEVINPEAFSTPVQQLKLADVARQIEMRWRQNQARLIASLHEHQHLRRHLFLEEATDVLWALTSYDLYRMLVVEQGWEPERYEMWLAQLLVEHLLHQSDG